MRADIRYFELFFERNPRDKRGTAYICISIEAQMLSAWLNLLLRLFFLPCCHYLLFVFLPLYFVLFVIV